MLVNHFWHPAALQAGLYVGIVDFHAIAGTAALLVQIGQQAAIAAAQIQYMGTLRHQPRNRLDRYQSAAHAATLRSK